MEKKIENKNVHTIVKEWLMANGYDGLYNLKKCPYGCTILDLATCFTGLKIDCQAGYMQRTSKRFAVVKPYRNNIQEQGEI